MKKKVKIQRKALLYLTLSLGICAGILLVNKYLIEVPDWLAIVLIVFALISFFMCVFNYFSK
jgi:hypothetical protein